MLDELVWANWSAHRSIVPLIYPNSQPWTQKKCPIEDGLWFGNVKSRMVDQIYRPLVLGISMVTAWWRIVGLHTSNPLLSHYASYAYASLSRMTSLDWGSSVNSAKQKFIATCEVQSLLLLDWHENGCAISDFFVASQNLAVWKLSKPSAWVLHPLDSRFCQCEYLESRLNWSHGTSIK